MRPPVKQSGALPAELTGRRLRREEKNITAVYRAQVLVSLMVASDGSSKSFFQSKLWIDSFIREDVNKRSQEA